MNSGITCTVQQSRPQTITHARDFRTVQQSHDLYTITRQYSGITCTMHRVGGVYGFGKAAPRWCSHWLTQNQYNNAESAQPRKRAKVPRPLRVREGLGPRLNLLTRVGGVGALAGLDFCKAAPRWCLTQSAESAHNQVPRPLFFRVREGLGPRLEFHYTDLKWLQLDRSRSPTILCILLCIAVIDRVTYVSNVHKLSPTVCALAKLSKQLL